MPDIPDERRAPRGATGPGARTTSLRQALGLATAIAVGIALVVGLVPDTGWEAWLALGLALVLFGLDAVGAVGTLFDRVGGIVAAGLVALLLVGTGGPDSVFQDVFVVILVYGGVVFGWQRLAVDVVAVGVAAAVPGVLAGAGTSFYADLAADLVVWTIVAALAVVLASQVRRATSRARRLFATIDEVPGVVLVVDGGTMEVRYVNRAAAAIVGRTPGEVAGRPLWEVARAISEEETRKLVARLEVDGDAVVFERTLPQTDPPRVYETSARLVEVGDEHPQLVLVAHDVTEQRQAASTARERAAMVEAADTAMVGTDVRGWIRSWNRAAEQLYGVSRDDAVGQHVADVIEAPADDPIQGRAPFDVTDEHLRYTGVHGRADGSRFEAEVTAWPVGATSGSPPGVAVLVRDVSQQRSVAQDLRRREQRFRTFAEQARGVVYRAQLCPEARLTYISPRVDEVLGDDPDGLLEDATPLFARIHPDDGHPFADEARWEEGVHTYRVRRTDGSWVWLEDHHSPERDADGQIVASQGILFDISTRKELEEARREALEHERAVARELERTMTAQQTFMRSVSHELRTPLTAVRGFAHTLRDHLGRLDEEQTDKVLRRLVANVERLDEQLADLLDLDLSARDPSGDRRGRVDLRSVALAAVGSVQARGHELRVRVPQVEIQGDQLRLSRAVTSLVGNAVRHTPPGTIVTLSLDEADDAVTLHVVDDGPGVDPDLVESMFEPFVQGEQAITSPRPGAGVGLALVREVAALHGGCVDYRPRVPRGAHFTLKLPREQS